MAGSHQVDGAIGHVRKAVSSFTIQTLAVEKRKSAICLLQPEQNDEATKKKDTLIQPR